MTFTDVQKKSSHAIQESTFVFVTPTINGSRSLNALIAPKTTTANDIGIASLGRHTVTISENG